MRPSDVSAVVCTMNSISSIAQCLQSLRDSGIEEVIVVDANSSDGTQGVADQLADLVLQDPGTGLGNARNIGIASSTKPLILNMGSDNIMLAWQLQRMIDYLSSGDYEGVSAQTIIEGNDYVSRGLNAWRKGRFIPGPTAVIGTPTLFVGDLLRSHPYDTGRVFSDDSELCERWAREYGARFAISDAYVSEIGKTSWDEVMIRCRMYGISDEDVFRSGLSSGWSRARQLQSLAHPLRADFLRPIANLAPMDAAVNAPFLGAFTALRYHFWLKTVLKR